MWRVLVWMKTEQVVEMENGMENGRLNKQTKTTPWRRCDGRHQHQVPHLHQRLGQAEAKPHEALALKR